MIRPTAEPRREPGNLRVAPSDHGALGGIPPTGARKSAPAALTPLFLRVLYVAFGFSGAAALLYETAWTRLLALLLGHTTAAATSVLAAFMGGLAIGAAIAGRFGPRLGPAAALRGYALLELLIGALALAVPLEIAGLRPLLSIAYADGHGGTTFVLLRFACALVVVTLPAVAMGATLPLVVRAAVGSAAHAGRDTARLYAANACGATAGAIVSGFVLLPALGMRGTTITAVALNALSALIALRLAGRVPAGAAAIPAAARVRERAPRGRTREEPAGSLRRIAALSIAMSGGASLILQIAWTRILALVVGPTTYAFSAMVAVFIGGITIGSMIGGWLGRRGPSPAWLAGSLCVSGGAAVAAAAWAPHIPQIVAGAVASPSATFEAMTRLQWLVIAGVMLPMTVAFGASFPLAVGLAARDDARVAADVAIVYVANTLGAIGGALLGGFVLVPYVGLQHSVGVAAAIVIAGATLVAMARAATGMRRAAIGLTGAAVAIAIWLPPSWDRAQLSSGAYKYAAYLPAEHRGALLGAGTLLYYREGAAATVSVRRLAGATMLAIDGKVDASNAGDMLTQRLLAHVPLLLHEHPRRVAIIGLGSGVTLGSALRHPVDLVETVEISPEVVEASAHFSRENGGALADPRARLIQGDGRSHLMLGTTPYDAVISEPSNPWMAGIASLFTRELFDAVRQRLAPGGVFCQWAHAYDISDADLRSIVATFIDVFPQASIWTIGDGDVLLVGSREPLETRLAGVRSAWKRPGVADDLASVGVTSPEVLLSLFDAARSALQTYAAGARMQRDDRMALEFTAPRSLYGATAVSRAGALRSLSAPEALPEIVREARAAATHRRDRGLMLLHAEAFGPAAADLLRAVEHDPSDAAAIDGLLRAAAAAERLDEAERLLRGALDRDPMNAAAAVGLSRVFASRGNFADAAGVLRHVLAARADAATLEQLASVFADAGEAEQLARVVERLRQIAPEAGGTRYFAAVSALMAGRPAEAAHLIEQGDRSAARARDFTLLGTAYASIGRRDDARRAFEAAISADPRDPAAYENLGAFELSRGDARAAARYYAEALSLDRDSPAARQGFADAVRRGR